MKKNLLAFSLVMLGLGSFAQTPRLCLYEEFTGENCGPCASTNPGLNSLLSSPTNTPKIVAIKWQVPIPSAPSATWSLYQTNKTEINWRADAAPGGYGYNPAVTYAPFGKIDGQSQAAFGATGGNVDHPANMTNNIIATAQSYTSAFSVTMARAWDATGSAVNLTVTITASAPFTSVGSLVFRTVMVEETINFATAPGSNGEKDFYNPAIKSFPSIQSGVAMASHWTLGQTQTFTLNCTLPSYVRKKEQVAFVGFIQDDGNQKVAQAVRAGKAQLTNDAVAISAQVPLTCTTSITPNVVVYNNGLTAITALTITPYSDAVVGPITSWTGNLAPGSSTTIALNAIPSSTASGSHLFSYNITAMNSVDFNLTNNTAQTYYAAATNYQGVPVAEPFSLSAYPPAKWTVVNADNGPSWSRVTYAGSYNIAPLGCSKYDFFDNTVIGDKDELYLPPINLSGATDPQMSFDVAYAQRTANSDDALDIFASDDCGTTWTNVYNSHGAALATALPNSFAYVPDPSNPAEWKTETVSLTGFNNPSVIVKFVTTNNNGNNMYLDNVNLSQSNPTGIAKIGSSQMSVGLYPNPTNGLTNVKIASVRNVSGKISVINTLGQTVLVKEVALNEGANTVQIDMKEYASGIYNVVINTGDGSIVKKLNVTK